MKKGRVLGSCDRKAGTLEDLPLRPRTFCPVFSLPVEMIDVNRQYDSHLGARLLDFFSEATPWHRGLWGIGLVLKLKEILEASEAVRHRVLNEPALKELVGLNDGVSWP